MADDERFALTLKLAGAVAIYLHKDAAVRKCVAAVLFFERLRFRPGRIHPYTMHI